MISVERSVITTQTGKRLILAIAILALILPLGISTTPVHASTGVDVRLYFVTTTSQNTSDPHSVIPRSTLDNWVGTADTYWRRTTNGAIRSVSYNPKETRIVTTTPGRTIDAAETIRDLFPHAQDVKTGYFYTYFLNNNTNDLLVVLSDSAEWNGSPATQTSGHRGVALTGSGIIHLGSTHTARNLTHEIGHTLGLAHASSATCGNLTDCTLHEYGDKLSVMGTTNGGTVPDWKQETALTRYQLGLLDDGGVTTVGTVGTSTVTLNPLNPVVTIRQALRVTDTDGTVYWAEYRPDVSGDQSQRGVAVLATGPRSSLGVSMKSWVLNTDGADGLLQTGQAWTSPTGMVMISVTALSETEATLRVRVKNEAPVAPVVTVTPQTVEVPASGGLVTVSVDAGGGGFIAGTDAWWITTNPAPC